MLKTPPDPKTLPSRSLGKEIAMKITVRGDSFVIEPETSNEANRLSRLVGCRVFLTEEGCFPTNLFFKNLFG